MGERSRVPFIRLEAVMTPDDLRKRATTIVQWRPGLPTLRAIAALYELAEKYEVWRGQVIRLVGLKIWSSAARGHARPRELSPTAP
jgi:hypothetical protein